MIECRIPVSPTPAFLNRVLLIAASVRRFYPDALFRVYVGQNGGATSESIRLVQDAFAGRNIGWQWIGQREFDDWRHTRAPYLATMNRRFSKPVDGDHVIIMDADIIITDRFDELFEEHAVQGVMAHVAPLDDDQWRYLFAIAGLPPPFFSFPLSGGGIMGPVGRLTPWYANSGFVFAPRDLFEQLIVPYQEAINTIRQSMADVYWADQLALALAVAKSGIPCQSLPMQFNFPNQRDFDLHYSKQLDNVKVLHFLRTDIVDRDRDFASIAAIERFVSRTDLVGSNEVLRRNVAETFVGALM